MAKGPEWFQDLPQVWQDVIEQILHGFMGFGARLSLLDLLIWWREDIKQWPPGKPILIDRLGVAWDGLDYPHKDGHLGKWYFPEDRVVDSRLDSFSFHVGYTLASVVVYVIMGLLVWIAWDFLVEIVKGLIS